MSQIVLTAVLSCLLCFLKSIQVYLRYRADCTRRVSAVALTGAGSDTAADSMSSLTLNVHPYRKTCDGLSQPFCLLTPDEKSESIRYFTRAKKKKKIE